jgi:aerobic carbon-monoxide dehydrogenase small subunit
MRVTVDVTVNGAGRTATVDSRMLLADMIRDELRLTGTHIGCATGNCGACTVVLDGLTVKSCCILAADVDGQDMVTIEGLPDAPGELHPIQQAFVRNQGLQCGYCTPGMILSAKQLLDSNPNPTEDEIRHGISGNLCRCTGYHFIVESIEDAARELRGEQPADSPEPAGTPTP